MILLYIWLFLGYTGSFCGIYNFQGCIFRKREMFAQWFILPVFLGPVWFILMSLMAFSSWMEP